MTPDRWRRLRVAVEAALEAPPERRDSVLSKECAGDSRLMAEARSLLRAADHLGWSLARRAASVGRARPRTPAWPFEAVPVRFPVLASQQAGRAPPVAA